MNIFNTKKTWSSVVLIVAVAITLIFVIPISPAQASHPEGEESFEECLQRLGDLQPDGFYQGNERTREECRDLTSHPVSKPGTGAPSALIVDALVKDGVGGAIATGALGFIRISIEFATTLLKFVISWSADLLNAVFNVQTFLDVPVVQVGWALARDLANIFFIAILLVIAFATILRVSTYGMKALLPRLIIIALLINFSLLFAGIFIDIGTDIGFFFVTGGNPTEQGDVGDAVIQAMGLQRAAGNQDAFANLNFGTGGTDIEGIVRLFMQALFLLVAAFILAAMAIMLFIRIPVLWVMLMFLPLALVASILPSGRNIWKQWVSKFTDWAFFPAILGFFVYFAIIAGQGLNESPVIESDFAFGGGLLGFTLKNLLQYGAVVAILFYGLVQSKKMGIVGAEYMMNVATKTKDVTLQRMKRPFVRGGEKIREKKTSLVGGGLERAMYRKVTDPKTGEVRLEARSGTQLIAGKVGGRYLVGAGNRRIRERRDAIREKKKEYEGLTKDPHLLATDILGKKGDDELAAVEVGREEGVLQKLHKGGQISDSQLANYQDRLDKLGMGGSFAKTFLDVMVGQAKRTEDEAVEIVKNMSGKDWDKARHDLLPKLKSVMSSGNYETLQQRAVEKYGGNQFGKMLEKGQHLNLQELEQFVYSKVSPRGTTKPRKDYLDYITTIMNNPRLAKYLEKNTSGQELFTDPQYVTP